MIDDELQVLGTEKKSKKKNKVVIAVIAIVALLAIGGLYFAYSSDIPFYKFNIDENEIPIRSGRDNLIGVSSLEDLYIVGTPSLFLLKEGKIDTYYLGEKEIVEYIQSAK